VPDLVGHQRRTQEPESPPPAGAAGRQAGRGLNSLIPQRPENTAGQRAANRLLGLREITMSAAVAEAACELLADACNHGHPDEVTRHAIEATVNRLRHALDQAQPQGR
jgi:hypothetical protein